MSELRTCKTATQEEVDALVAELAEAKRDLDDTRTRLEVVEEQRDQALEDVRVARSERRDTIEELRRALGARPCEPTLVAARRVMRERSIRVRLRDAVRAAREAW